MAFDIDAVQPGRILHEAIGGAFKGRGLTFQAWCAEAGVNWSTVRNATYGQSGGDKGRALLARAIEAAGPELVLAIYRRKMDDEVARLRAAAAEGGRAVA
jgi:hypothetical protein